MRLIFSQLSKDRVHLVVETMYLYWKVLSKHLAQYVPKALGVGVGKAVEVYGIMRMQYRC